jgi:exonuclease III
MRCRPTEPIMELSIVWWNTSLSPAKKPGLATEKDKAIVFHLIELLTTQREIDIICLGEMAAPDVDQMRMGCALEGYSVYEGMSKVGASRFDVCVLFRSERLVLLDTEQVVPRTGSTRMKVGQRLDFAVDDQDVMHLFVSHWPSRLWCEENHADRHAFGLYLRQAVEKVLGPEFTSHVVVLGDFNDDPFAKSLEHQLMATRDRALARHSRHLMYNPFWRHLSSNAAHPHRATAPSHAGSYFYDLGKRTKWHTFDQIIFSSSFLGHSSWKLNEDKVGIIDLPGYTELVASRTARFDHLPVTATIEKEKLNG